MKKRGSIFRETQYKVERENSHRHVLYSNEAERENLHRIYSTVQYIINLRGTTYRYVLYINEV
jgi:hypothetical protein